MTEKGVFAVTRLEQDKQGPPFSERHALRSALVPRRELPSLPVEIAVKRSDPVYNAHAYLTKIPYSAIVPFVEALTEPGDRVLDVFAGSGMTGIAAAVSGRRAELRDISVLGRHIGSNYIRLVDANRLHEAGSGVMAAASKRVGEVYATRCADCDGIATLSKTVWSFQYACSSCERPITYYDAFKAADWIKKKMRCPACSEHFSTRNARRIDQLPVLDYVRCSCSGRIREQRHTQPLVPVCLDGLEYADTEIGADRQMFHASALGKHGLLSTSAFFSERNLAILAGLRGAITTVEDEAIRGKLTFALTAVLTRASRRYQWHPKRPLNASNQNYYIAPVYYEWNVYELFERKIQASVRSDQFIKSQMRRSRVDQVPTVVYRLGSADALDLPDRSIDYVFTDPPFGSNIFYSDMNLFQETWLEEFTDDSREAVIDRSGNGTKRRSAGRYERLIVDALKECRRVLRPGGRLSLVFSNSSGEMWMLVQRAFHAAGFALEHVTLLDKGQRSVKGLSSGVESIVTSDLILTLGQAAERDPTTLRSAPPDALRDAIEETLGRSGPLSPTKVYLSTVTKYLRNGWKVSDVAVGDITRELLSRGYTLDAASGGLTATGRSAA